MTTATIAKVLTIVSFGLFCNSPAPRPPSNPQRSPERRGGLVIGVAGPEEGFPADVVLQTGHKGRVTVLAFSPDKSLLASGSEDKTVRLWNPESGLQLCSLNGHTGPVRSLAFSHDGRLLASGADDHTIRLWNTDSARLAGVLEGSEQAAIALNFSPDKKLLVSGEGVVNGEGSSGVINIWNVSTATTRFQFGEPDRSNGDVIGFSPDSRFLAGGRTVDGFELFNLTSGKPLRSFPVSGRVSAIAFSPNNQTIALGTRALFRPRTVPGRGDIVLDALEGQSAELSVWDYRKGTRLFSVPAGHWVSAIRFIENGSSLLAVNGNFNVPGTICVYDFASGRKTATIRDRVAADTNAVFGPDGNWLAGSTSGLIGIVRLWRLESRH